MSTRYIVVFKKHVGQESIDKYAEEVYTSGGVVTQRFDPLLNGFAAHIPESFLQTLQSLQGDIIDYIEPDSIITTQ